ncbi:probable L-type lectin-domain containing receptor kinase VII.2 [Typha angustifolia]|uniref:probable L-type lectin-domain containing receptor kinase VII.2 n=1 Tax=Typha angustifolia TaxID=59011 RepID=UPI003C2D2B79
MKKRRKTAVLFSLAALILLCYSTPSTAVDLLFNGFDPSDLLLYADATVVPGRRYISLTAPSNFSIGRALHRNPIPTRRSSDILPFSASFIFSIAPIPDVLPGHGLAFLFAPAPGTLGATSAQNLGLFNLSSNRDNSSRVLAVEFDVFQNPEFFDINANHVGVDRNSLTSIAAASAGYWPDDGSSGFVNLTLNDGSNYQAWIDYAGGRLNVTMAPAIIGRKPRRPLISVDIDLSDLFLDEMYVGFCAATGKLVEHHRVLAWSFSNSNFSLGDGLITSNLPDFISKSPRSSSRSGKLVAVISATAAITFISAVAALIILIYRRRRRIDIEKGKGGDEEAVEEWELEYWPHRIGYRKILIATDNFSDKNLIGSGGNGRVYKGVLSGAEVAVKLFSQEDAKQFAAEVSSLGRLKHRNLVGLRGWCRTRKAGAGFGEVMALVYDFMVNGSLDSWIFDRPEPLDWGSRARILREVASAVQYLHEGWGEACVLHRDIKASNVLLDRSMTARLGDFGLARAHPHGSAGLGTTRVVGSAGYLAPEIVRNGKATSATDVYAFGVLALEMVTGRRAVEEGRPPLVEWARSDVAWDEVVDPRVRGTEGYDDVDVERTVRVGLECTCDDRKERPTMRWVAAALEGADDDTWLSEETLGSTGDRMTWRWARRGEAQLRHLTFEELRQSMSGSTSLSGSDLIVEGR